MPGRHTPHPDQLLTTRAAMKRLGISRRTLFTWTEHGLVTVYKIGTRNRYDIAELDALITPKDRP